MTQKEKNNKTYMVHALSLLLLGLVGTVVFFNSFAIISPGERGVVFSTISGVQDNILGEGFHFKLPLIHNVVAYDVRTLRNDMSTASTSLDQQIVKASVTVNYRVDETTVNRLHQQIGTAYYSRIIAPALEASIKSAMAKFRAEDLIRERDKVMLEIQEALNNRIQSRHIIIENVALTNIEFSTTYTDAIEQKVVAEQLELKAVNDLRRIEIEAQQKVVQAQAEAESLRIQQEVLQESQEILQLRFIEKWDGVLPRVVSGNDNLMLLVSQEGN